MTQTVRSQWIYSGWKIRLLNKPLVLNRIFFTVKVLTDPTTDYKLYISLGDPGFSSYFTLGGQVPYFEAKGEGIFQGDIWAQNVSAAEIYLSMSEILV